MLVCRTVHIYMYIVLLVYNKILSKNDITCTCFCVIYVYLLFIYLWTSIVLLYCHRIITCSVYNLFMNKMAFVLLMSCNSLWLHCSPVNFSVTEINFRRHKYIFAFSVILQRWNGKSCWNHSSWKTSGQAFSNMSSDWLAAQLPAYQKLCCNRTVLIMPIPGPISSIVWLPKVWWRMEQGHLQPEYWPSSLRIFHC